MNKRTSRGFTLIELLVVVAIIAVMTGIVLASLQNSRAKSRDGKRVSDISQIQLSLEQFFDQCNQYPNSIGTAGTAPTNVFCGGSGSSPIVLSNFISVVPVPPSGTYDYAYQTNSGGLIVDYVLHTHLEKANDDVIRNGLASFPTSTGWNTSFTCSNQSGSLDYCIGPK